MTRFRVIKTADRRANPSDRRRPVDRRRTAGLTSRRATTVKMLRELLDEAHQRIRTLERAIKLRAGKLP